LRIVVLFLAACAAAADQPDTLLEPMNRFAAAYNDFTAGMQKGLFDARQAKRLSKLWREVEHSGNWPEVAAK